MYTLASDGNKRISFGTRVNELYDKSNLLSGGTFGLELKIAKISLILESPSCWFQQWSSTVLLTKVPVLPEKLQVHGAIEAESGHFVLYAIKI
jgi:hypothetical protein